MEGDARLDEVCDGDRRVLGCFARMLTSRKVVGGVLEVVERLGHARPGKLGVDDSAQRWEKFRMGVLERAVCMWMFEEGMRRRKVLCATVRWFSRDVSYRH